MTDHRAKRTVLVVEDQQMLANLYASVLKRKGWEVTLAADETTALKFIETQPPTVVLSDYHLPQGNGISLIEKVREHVPTACAILVSGYLTSDLLDKALANGAFMCLKKPVPLHKLVATIEEAYERSCQLLAGDTHFTSSDNMRHLQSRIEGMSSCAAVIDTEYRIVATNSVFAAHCPTGSIGSKCYELFGLSGRMCPGCRAVAAFELGKAHVLERAAALSGDGLTAIVEHVEPVQLVDGKKFAILSLVQKPQDSIRVIQNSRSHAASPAKRPGTQEPAMATTTFDGTLLSVNDAFTNLFGPLPKAVTPRSFLDVCDSWLVSSMRDREATFYQFVTQNSRIEFTARLAGNGALPMVWHFHPSSLPPDGKLIVTCVGRPVAEEQTLDNLVGFLNATAERIFSGQFDMALVCDNTMRIVATNRPLRKVLGVKSRDLYGAPLRSILATDADADYLKEVFSAPTGSGVFENLSFSLRRADGSQLGVFANGASVNDKYNVAQGLTLIMRDTLRQEAFNREIARAERTHMLGELSAGIVHQLNNYVQSISGWAQLLYLEEGANENISSILEAAQGMQQLVVEILQLASQREIVKLQEINLNDIIDSVRRLTKWRLNRDRIVLDYAGEPVTATLHTSPSALEQVLLCVVINAADAILEAQRPITHRRITISLSAASDEIAIDVSDTGCGIPQAQQREVFSTFFTTKPTGTGLGLSLARTLMKAIRGRIELLSSTSDGSIFRIALPRVQGPIQVERTPQDAARSN